MRRLLDARGHFLWVMYLTFPVGRLPYSSSGMSTGSLRGLQTPQWMASSTTSARSA
jgi:hypothetical protein